MQVQGIRKKNVRRWITIDRRTDNRRDRRMLYEVDARKGRKIEGDWVSIPLGGHGGGEMCSRTKVCMEDRCIR
jgi:hypothetical protein